MIHKYFGDTVLWEIHLEDVNGTDLLGESPVLRVSDNDGSQVLSGTGTHISDGSYLHQDNVGTDWGTGPISYYWDIRGANGTIISPVTNEINILSGTKEQETYIFESELVSYYSRIEDYLDEHSKEKLLASKKTIDRLLESLNIKTPREKDANGFYDQSLRDMNAWFGIYQIVADREVNRIPGDEIPWYNKFWEEGTRIYDAIKKKKIVMKDQVSPAEAGISKPSRVLGSSIGTMFNNWDRSYGRGFQGSDFRRDWVVKVVGTGTSGGLEEGTCHWSNDGGISWGTITTSFNWVHLLDEVYVHFGRGTAEGTANILAVGDQWEFVTEPIRKQTGGIRTAKSVPI